MGEWETGGGTLSNSCTSPSLQGVSVPGLTWDHTENIALALYEAHPDVDPLKVRFTDMHQWITELDDFGDDPKKSSEGKLEAIQMAWYEEWKEAQD